VKVYLVRHAKAQRRLGWEHADAMRPLSPGGHDQALGLVERFDGASIARVISSPALRCRQTAEPLAARFSLPVEIDPRLAEGASLSGAVSLVRSLGGDPAVLVCHGDLMPELVEKLVPGALALEGGAGCPKASTWLVQGPSGARLHAAYVPPPRVGAATPSADTKRRIAVVDLGSTSFTLLVADVTHDGHIVRVEREREMLRLGAAIAQDSKLSEELCERAVDAARSLRRVADRNGAQELFAVATSAMRDAKNGKKLAERIERALGSDVQILSGEEEARLIFAAFRRRVGLGEEFALGLDLGGGSLELAVGNASALRFESTLRLGVTRLQSELVKSDPLSAAEVRALRTRVEESLDPIAGRVRALAPARTIATGGTVRALARIVLGVGESEAPGDLRGMLLAADDLDALSRRLVRTSHDERLALPGMDEKRADLLPIGAIVLSATLEALRLPGLMICDWGLREGVILAALERETEEPRRRGLIAAG
jgi:exopolyphosphatase/guanosine-5'-triphosphate,3'-diphosphate pyrophosphatase